jgi:hypothetical protein
MKSLITATVLAFSASAALAGPSDIETGSADLGLRLLIEQLGDDDGNTSDLSQILSELLGLADGGSAELAALLDQLSSLDFQALADEIAAFRNELQLYRYEYVGVADALVQEGEQIPAFWNLSAMCEDTFGEGARLARTSDVAYLLEGADFPLEGVDRGIFKSSLPIPYREGLYDTLVNAKVDLDGLVIYDGGTDRFGEKEPARVATPACSMRGA